MAALFPTSWPPAQASEFSGFEGLSTPSWFEPPTVPSPPSFLRIYRYSHRNSGVCVFVIFWGARQGAVSVPAGRARPSAGNAANGGLAGPPCVRNREPASIYIFSSETCGPKLIHAQISAAFCATHPKIATHKKMRPLPPKKVCSEARHHTRIAFETGMGFVFFFVSSLHCLASLILFPWHPWVDRASLRVRTFAQN